MEWNDKQGEGCREPDYTIKPEQSGRQKRKVFGEQWNCIIGHLVVLIWRLGPIYYHVIFAKLLFELFCKKLTLECFLTATVASFRLKNNFFYPFWNLYVCRQVPDSTPATPAMSLKIFLPMREKPPDEFGWGSCSSQQNYTTILSFHLLKWAQEKNIAFLPLPTRYATSLFIVNIFCQTPLPQPLPQDAPTSSPTALQNAWKIGIEFTGPNTGAGQSNPLTGFVLTTSLPVHLYNSTRNTTTPHCMTALPIHGIIKYNLCLPPMHRSGITMGALRHYYFPCTS